MEEIKLKKTDISIILRGLEALYVAYGINKKDYERLFRKLKKQGAGE